MIDINKFPNTYEKFEIKADLLVFTERDTQISENMTSTSEEKSAENSSVDRVFNGARGGRASWRSRQN